MDTLSHLGFDLANEKMGGRTLATDPRWETVLLPLSDGLTMLRKR